MTTFAVAYDRGAVNAAEVALSLGALGDLVFVGHEAGPAGPLVPLLRELGEVLFLDDGLEPVLTRLAAIGIDAVVTFSDTMMPVAAHIADRLGLRFHSAPVVALLTDKLRQRDELRAHGVDEVRAHPVRHMRRLAGRGGRGGRPRGAQTVAGTGKPGHPPRHRRRSGRPAERGPAGGPRPGGGPRARRVPGRAPQRTVRRLRLGRERDDPARGPAPHRDREVPDPAALPRSGPVLAFPAVPGRRAGGRGADRARAERARGALRREPHRGQADREQARGSSRSTAGWAGTSTTSPAGPTAWTWSS